jgi:hypothetical protein
MSIPLKEDVELLRKDTTASFHAVRDALFGVEQRTRADI